MVVLILELKYYLRLKYYLEFHNILLKVTKITNKRAEINVIYKESWVQKNWRFWTAVLEKTLESPLDSKEIQPVHPKGDQSSVFIGRTDVEAEIPILWPPHVKSWLIWKDPDAGKDWGREEKGMTEDEMVGWCRDQLNKQGFRKRDTAREWERRHKNSEKNEDQGTNTAPRWRCWNWIQASFIILSSVNERICRELNYNSVAFKAKEQNDH